mgnify:CR=1 FL=1
MAEKKPTNDMNKRLSFKDFMTVEYKPGEDELVNYRAYRRRRLEDTDHSEYSLEDILEVISRGERMRRKRAASFGPLKHKLKRGRLKAKRRFASKDVLSNRSRKGSRKAIEKKFTKGIPKSKLSIAQKQSLERKLERPAIQKRIALQQRRLMPKKRRQEIARKQGSWKK